MNVETVTSCGYHDHSEPYNISCDACASELLAVPYSVR